MTSYGTLGQGIKQNPCIYIELRYLLARTSSKNTLGRPHSFAVPVIFNIKCPIPKIVLPKIFTYLKLSLGFLSPGYELGLSPIYQKLIHKTLKLFQNFVSKQNKNQIDGTVRHQVYELKDAELVRLIQNFAPIFITHRGNSDKQKKCCLHSTTQPYYHNLLKL